MDCNRKDKCGFVSINSTACYLYSKNALFKLENSLNSILYRKELNK